MQSNFRPASKISIVPRMRKGYAGALKRLVKFLRRNGWHVTAMVLATFLFEPLHALKAGFLNIASWKKHFNFHGMNPTILADKHLKKRPILLIHGNYHNQSAWMKLAKQLTRNNLGPLYTVNLPSGAITKNDYDIIHRKMTEIKAQYKQRNITDIKIDLVGHSRGGSLAHKIAWTTEKTDRQCYGSRSNDIGKVIKIGDVFDQEALLHIQREDPHFNGHIYEITGDHDVLVPNPSLCPLSHQAKVNAGHLGLLYSPTVHHRVIQWLSD